MDFLGNPFPNPRSFAFKNWYSLPYGGGGLFGQHEAAEYERPHFLRALSITPGAHANSLNVSFGYARTYTRSWPIRPSLLTDQSRHLNARHAQGDVYSHSRTSQLSTNNISSHRSESCIVHNTFSRLINLFLAMVLFWIEGVEAWPGVVRRTDRFLTIKWGGLREQLSWDGK